MGREQLAKQRARWTRLALAVALALQASVARADLIVPKPSESDDDLMARVLGPSSQLAQKVVRSTEIAGGKLTLIGFAPAQDDSLVGHLLIEKSPGHFEHITFPSCEIEGAAPELLAVFFARTVKDGGRDLAVLCRWEQQHATVNGMLYGAQFYRLKEKDSRTAVEPVTDLNKQFEADDLVRQNDHGKWVQGPKAKFTTVAQVKKLLTKMGLKQ